MLVTYVSLYVFISFHFEFTFSVRMRVFAVDSHLKPHMSEIDLKIMVIHLKYLII